MHDFLGNAFDLDVHLQGRDTIGGAGDLEVHVTKVIFVTQDIGQNCKAIAVLDQTHGYSRHMSLDGHAGVHQGKAASTNTGHRGRPVRFSDFRNYTHRISKIFRTGQHAGKSSLGETAMSYFTALWRADTAGFARGIWRHVVVKHEAFFVFTLQGIDDLLISPRAKGGNNQGLRLAPCK